MTAGKSRRVLLEVLLCLSQFGVVRGHPKQRKLARSAVPVKDKSVLDMACAIRFAQRTTLKN